MKLYAIIDLDTHEICFCDFERNLEDVMAQVADQIEGRDVVLYEGLSNEQGDELDAWAEGRGGPNWLTFPEPIFIK